MSHYSYIHTHTHTHTRARARAYMSTYIHILFLFFLYYIMCLHLTIIDHQNLQNLNSIRIKRRSTANRSVSSVGKSPMRGLTVQERRKKVAGILSLKIVWQPQVYLFFNYSLCFLFVVCFLFIAYHDHSKI